MTNKKVLNSTNTINIKGGFPKHKVSNKRSPVETSKTSRLGSLNQAKKFPTPKPIYTIDFSK